jgi:hypothetical protein
MLSFTKDETTTVTVSTMKINAEKQVEIRERERLRVRLTEGASKRGREERGIEAQQRP